MEEPKTIIIDPLSCTSLRIELRVLGKPLSTASAFVVQGSEAAHLVTNWHVLSGRNPETGELISTTGAIPDEIAIVHHMPKLGTWKVVTQPLLDDDGEPLWIEHPDGEAVDLAALELDLSDSDIQLYPFSLELAEHDVRLQPAMSVSIIGYPYGLATGVAFPIWKTGHIASDPDINYDGSPAFLIDATTRGGMSGSPVVYRSMGSYPSKSGALTIGGEVTAFFGVYSGRIHEDVEVGRVWRPHLIHQLLGQDDDA